MNYLVSIIIPVYNREYLLKETLNSLKTQTYSNWECIIVDDGSTDNSVEIASSFVREDHRFELFIRPADRNKGAASCRNYGYENCQGELIQFLDSDDLMSDNKLAEQVKVYSGNKFELLICKWGWFQNSYSLRNRLKSNYKSYKNFKRGKELLSSFGLNDEYFPIHNYLSPRSLINRTGRWNEELSNNDDAEFFSRVILNSSRISFVKEAEVYYRAKTEFRLSDMNSEAKAQSLIRSWKLIEEHCKKNADWRLNTYLIRAKYNIYKQLKDKYPNILEENRDFFKRRVNLDSTYIPYKKILKVLNFNFR